MAVRKRKPTSHCSSPCNACGGASEPEERAEFIGFLQWAGSEAVVRVVMRKQGSGKLVHIGSRSGFEGEPGVSLYCASKFAVAGISEALSVEMAPFGIQSMVVEPGVFRTDFLDASSLSVAANRIADYDDTPAHVTLDWIDRANHAQLGDPVKGAALIVEAASTEKLPTHLYLGRDTLERLDVKYQQVQDDLAPWREKSAATAHEDAA
ncbi:SDR family NAD(P)-dependent oxidoreductase [Streptomyces sp. NBC_01483]